jgi:hypothetical protein
MPMAPVPFLTTQSQSGHPFFIGQAAQTSRSKNVWVDQRGRVSRRPRLWTLADVPRLNQINRFFRYQYKVAGKRAGDALMGYNIPDYDGVWEGVTDDMPSVTIFSDAMQSEYHSEAIDGISLSFNTSRIHFTPAKR